MGSPVHNTNTPSTPKYPHISVKLTGEDGNAFLIMGKVKSALSRNDVPQEQIGEYLSESMSGDYNNLLVTAMKWVDVQ
jgi:hypothetical protein